MTEHRWIDLTALAGVLAAINWQTTVTVCVGVLSGLYYCTRLYKEWFGENKNR